jgi:hypothetical protein
MRMVENTLEARWDSHNSCRISSGCVYCINCTKCQTSRKRDKNSLRTTCVVCEILKFLQI